MRTFSSDEFSLHQQPTYLQDQIHGVNQKIKIRENNKPYCMNKYLQ